MMIVFSLLALQAAALPAAPPPDIAFTAQLRARSVTVEKQGEAKLSVTTSPEGANLVDVEAPRANGQTTLRNVSVKVSVEARIADPALAGAGAGPRNNPEGSETTPRE